MLLHVKLNVVSDQLAHLITQQLSERLSAGGFEHQLERLMAPSQAQTTPAKPLLRSGGTARGLGATAHSADVSLITSASTLPDGLIELISEALYPMSLSCELGPQLTPSPELELICVTLSVAPLERPLSLHVTSDLSAQHPLVERMGACPEFEVSSGVCLERTPSMTLRGVSPRSRRRLQWIARAAQLNLPAPLIELTPPRDDEADVSLHLPSETNTLKGELTRAQLCGDDFPGLMSAALGLLGGLKNPQYLLEPFSSEQSGREHKGPEWFEVSYGALSYHHELRAQLRAQLEALLRARGVDLTNTPLHERLDHTLMGWSGSPEALSELRAQRPLKLTLPFKRAEAGALFEPSPQKRGHWALRISTDQPSACEPLLEALKGAGFMSPELIERPPHALHATLLSPENCPEELVESLCELTSKALSLPRLVSLTQQRLRQPQLALVSQTLEGYQGRLLELQLPLNDRNPIKHAQRLRERAAPLSFSLKCDAVTPFRGLWQLLTGVGFGALQLCEEEGAEGIGEAVLRYGGAAEELMRYVQRVVESALEVSCRLERAWGRDDDEVWLTLPSELDAELGEALEVSEQAQRAWFAGAHRPQLSAPLLTLNDQELHVADLVLERPSLSDPLDLARVPSVESLGRYCLDQDTSETLYHVAEAVALKEPCLIEGPTSASKTSAILYLAALLGQPVARLNLSAQTDTGELIGRFAPDEGGWAWRDGLVVTALKRGWWLILDELNLAEPQVLERLNSLLERSPSLTLSERDGRLIGAQGEPISPSFRVFGTMNPSAYAGRAPLSPAYRDRWLSARLAPVPSERATHELIKHYLTDERPDVELFGALFEGVLVDQRLALTTAQATPSAPLSLLTEQPYHDELCASLARFHTGLTRAVSQGTSEVVLTRRSLIATLDYLAESLPHLADLSEPLGVMSALKRALWRYYVSRLSDPTHLKLAQTLWVTSGLEALSAQP